MSVILNWWLIPLFFTILFFTVAAFKQRERKGAYDFGTPMLNLGKFMIALILSLASWLIYFVCISGGML